ncbi:MAG: hypothetical protein AAFR10_16810 [Pseudomonadota bacterium]
MGEQYESLVAAIALIDAAQSILSDAGICHDEIAALHLMENDMNKDRLALLGNGQERPYNVSEIVLKGSTNAIR